MQKDDLDQPDAAVATLKDYLKRFPKSDLAGDAREALSEIADDARKSPGGNQGSSVGTGPAAQAQAAAQAKIQTAAAARCFAGTQWESGGAARGRQRALPHVTGVKTWNSEDSARIVVTLDDTMAFDAARIASPDRVYFDLHQAQTDPDIAKKNRRMLRRGC